MTLPTSISPTSPSIPASQPETTIPGTSSTGMMSSTIYNGNQIVLVDPWHACMYRRVTLQHMSVCVYDCFNFA